MKILVIADTHGALNNILNNCKEELNVDLVILLGDIYRNELLIIDELFKEIPIIGIYGNHDIENLYERTHIKNIHKQLYYTNNISIIGFQGSIKYKPNQLFGYTQEESIQEFKDLINCDILCCHDGPYKYGDNDAHIGLKGITKYIKKHKPKILLFGHHHKNNYFKLKHTECYNIYGISIFNMDKTKILNWTCYTE